MSDANLDHPVECECGQCRYSTFQDIIKDSAWMSHRSHMPENTTDGRPSGCTCNPYGKSAHMWCPVHHPAPKYTDREFAGSLPNKRVSVLQDWVMELPLREQGTLLTAVRGCDLTPKEPLDSVERQLVGFIRYCFMVPADPREVDHSPGCFFRSTPPDPWKTKASVFGHYPQHWVSHIMHALEVIGYRRPHDQATAYAANWYINIANSMHLNCETLEQFEARLSEDRIATGEVVS